jgi:deoxyribose-phosphate aldolase
VGVKASGGIRTIQQALRFVELGATRLGTSSTESLVEQEAGVAASKRAPASAETY